MDSETLSIILPTSNRQDLIENRIERLLDHVCDLCGQIQIVIVDDGSTDATPEILDELRRTYPQIETIRNQRRQGPKHAVELGLEKAIGTFVFLHESYDSVDLHAIRQLWSLRNERDLVVARVATKTRRIDSALLDQLTKWGKRLEEHWRGEDFVSASKPLSSGLQMVRRESLEKLARVDSQEPAFDVSHLSQRSIVPRRSPAFKDLR